MQEVFADLFRQLGRYRGEATLQTYLFRIVTNKACDHLRQRQRRQRDTADGPIASPNERLAGKEFRSLAPTPEDCVRDRQEVALVSQALDKLAPKKRIAFLLRVVEELSLKEISDQVGATVFTVAQRIRHADRELHLLLEQGRRRRP
jgi:RNA polymerase sigma-70 factor (ECF subfamily)